MSDVWVFRRPPLTSSCQFSTDDLQVPWGRLVHSAPVLLQVAGWLKGKELEPAQADPCGQVEGLEKEVDREAVAIFEGSSRWSGLMTLAPRSRVRLVGPSSYRLSYGRARNAAPRQVLMERSVNTQCESFSEWFEVSCEPSRSKAHGAGSATVEVCGPKKGEVNDSWQAVSWGQLGSPCSWPLVASDEPWVSSLGSPTHAPQPWRAAPHGLLAGGQAPQAVLSLLVVMAAVPPEAGVGCMTPNWTLLAALDEALFRALGARYQLYVAPISSEDQLEQLEPGHLKQLLEAEACGAFYFLSPQKVKGLRTKHDLIHDLPLFQLMERMEAARIPSLWPHPSYLYRILAGKEWPPHLCLCQDYRVPVTTRVSRQAILTTGRQAAEEAWEALNLLLAAVGRKVQGAVVKLGYSWRSAGVTLCRNLDELSRALSRAAAAGSHSSFLVQELVEDVVCEAMVYVIHGQVVGRPQYYRFPEHQAPPQYLARKAAQQLMERQLLELQQVEEVMSKAVAQWLLWARALCATPLPFLRIDFLLAASGVWTGEVSELGVAVELQGLQPQESRDMVMDAVVAASLRRIRPQKDSL